MHYFDGKYPNSGIFLRYDDDDYSQVCGQFKEAFRVFTKDNILKPSVCDHDFRYSIVRADDVCCNFYVFDKRV